MRPLHVFAIAAPLAAAIGCSLFEKNPDSGPRPTTTVAEYPAQRFVSYLNDRANRMTSISAKVQLTGHSEGLPFNLNGNLAAAQPRNFRMKGDGMVGGEVDLGSNIEQFWVYMKAPSQRPMFVYASHQDFETGRARLPDGIAFEPDWVMQALGMHVFPTDVRYNDPRIDQKDRTYTLSWSAQTPGGMTVSKEVVFDADDARDGRPQVKKHVIRDAKNKVICTATVKNAATVSLSASPDPRIPQPTAGIPLQYPTHVVLRWEAQHFELDLKLSDVQVNRGFPEEQTRHLFSRPPMNVEAINLASARFSAQ